MAEETDERWIHETALQWEYLGPGVVYNRKYDKGLETLFKEGYVRQLLAAIPTPNATNGWRVKSIMFRYSIMIAPSEFGFSPEIFHISMYDLDRFMWRFNRFFINTGGMFQDVKLDLPVPQIFNCGILVQIGLRYYYEDGLPIYSFVSFAGVGLEFVRFYSPSN